MVAISNGTAANKTILMMLSSQECFRAKGISGTEIRCRDCSSAAEDQQLAQAAAENRFWADQAKVRRKYAKGTPF